MGVDKETLATIQAEIEELDRQEDLRLRGLYYQGTGRYIETAVQSFGLTPDDEALFKQFVGEHVSGLINSKLGFFINAELDRRLGKTKLMKEFEKSYHDWLHFWEIEASDPKEGIRALRSIVDSEIIDINAQGKDVKIALSPKMLVAQRVLDRFPVNPS